MYVVDTFSAEETTLAIPEKNLGKGFARQGLCLAISSCEHFLAFVSKVVEGGEFDRDTECHIHLWDLQSGKELLRLHEPSENITSVALSRGGHRVVTASATGRIKVWNTTSRKVETILAGQVKAFHSLLITPDDTRIVAGDSQGTIRFWDLRTGLLLHSFKVSGGQLKRLAFDASGSQLSVNMERNGSDEILLFRSSVEDLFRPVLRHPSSLNLKGDISVNAKSDAVIVCGDPDYGSHGGVLIWDPKVGLPRTHIPCPDNTPWTTAVLRPDGGQVAVGTSVGGIILHDAITGREIRRWKAHEGWISSLAFDPNGGKLVSTGKTGKGRASEEDKGWELKSWDARSGSPLQTLSLDKIWQFPRAFISPVGDRIGVIDWKPRVVDSGSQLTVYDARSLRQLAQTGEKGSTVCAAAFTSDPEVLALVRWDDTKRVAWPVLWDSRSSTDRWRGRDLPGSWEHTLVVDQKTGRIIIANAWGNIRLYDPPREEPQMTFDTGVRWSEAPGLVFTGDGTCIVNESGHLVLWDARSGKMLGLPSNEK